MPPIDPVDPPVDPVDPPTDPTDPNRISLTEAIDNLLGTDGIDIFTGDNDTTSAADRVVGEDGVDSLHLFGTNITPNISGIEKVVYITPGGDISVANFSEVISVELKNAVQGHTITTTQGQAVTLTNIDTSNSGNGLIVLAGDSVTSLDLTLDKFGTARNDGFLDRVELTGTGLTTLNITGVNNASALSFDSAPNQSLLKTVNIAGDQDFTYESTRDVTMIDASSATGRVAIQISSTTDLTFKGGSGDDTIHMFDTLTSGDTLTGGAGIDMLRVSNGNTINSASAVSSGSRCQIEGSRPGT